MSKPRSTRKHAVKPAAARRDLTPPSVLKGSFVALVTPFAGGKIDYAAVENLIEHHVKQGTAGLVPCGTTGESATLSHKEHEDLITFVNEKAAGRLPVVAGTGSNATDEAIRLTRVAERAGCAAALVITPYYNKPTQAGLIAHFRAIGDKTGLPLVLYNVPSRTGCDLRPETVAALCEEGVAVAGVKEASGDVNRVTEILALCDVAVLAGDDALTLPMIALGASGVISVVANLLPDQMQALVAEALAGRYDAARRLHQTLYPVMKALFLETNPIPVKTALAMAGRISEELRLPLVPMSENNRAQLTVVLAELGFKREG